MRKHSPEPWKRHVTDGYTFSYGHTKMSCDIISGCGDEQVHIASLSGHARLKQANAERIVDCVNACAGINPEYIPKLLSLYSIRME